MTYRIPGEWQDEPIAKGPGVVERVARSVGKGVRAVWREWAWVLWIPTIAGVVLGIPAFFVERHHRFLASVRIRCLSEALDSEIDGLSNPSYLDTGREVFAVCIDADKKRVLRRMP